MALTRCDETRMGIMLRLIPILVFVWLRFIVIFLLGSLSCGFMQGVVGCSAGQFLCMHAARGFYDEKNQFFDFSDYFCSAIGFSDYR
uniref:Uncharacterized protein n=1 Tax=Magnetococcus massalia (strain MO-1) TaxID=451514 RepID=A0A1S7LDC0_MAGMO|nr:protein of unknown function [Candidatus Magnetococcus massalia]